MSEKIKIDELENKKEGNMETLENIKDFAIYDVKDFNGKYHDLYDWENRDGSNDHFFGKCPLIEISAGEKKKQVLRVAIAQTLNLIRSHLEHIEIGGHASDKGIKFKILGNGNFEKKRNVIYFWTESMWDSDRPAPIDYDNVPDALIEVVNSILKKVFPDCEIKNEDPTPKKPKSSLS